MTSISTLLMSGNPNTTSITSHLPQKSANSSLAHTSMNLIKTALYQLLKESQAKAGKLKLLTKINLSVSKLKMLLLLSMQFKLKL